MWSFSKRGSATCWSFLGGVREWAERIGREYEQIVRQILWRILVPSVFIFSRRNHQLESPRTVGEKPLLSNFLLRRGCISQDHKDPGGTTTPDPNPLKCEYDEIWVEQAYADTRSVADVAYTYWKDDHFQVAIVCAAADLRYVPWTVLSKDGKPSELEIFLYRLIDGEWFVLDHVSDRVWFDDAVKSLDK